MQVEHNPEFEWRKWVLRKSVSSAQDNISGPAACNLQRYPGKGAAVSPEIFSISAFFLVISGAAHLLINASPRDGCRTDVIKLDQNIIVDHFARKTFVRLQRCFSAFVSVAGGRHYSRSTGRNAMGLVRRKRVPLESGLLVEALLTTMSTTFPSSN